PDVAVLGQFFVTIPRQAGVRAGGDGVERADQCEEVDLAQALFLQVAFDATRFDQDRRYAGCGGEVAERARVEGVVPLGDVAGDAGFEHGADGDGDPDGSGPG